jgi:hypothetical protein
MNMKRKESTKQKHTQLSTVRKACSFNQILWETQGEVNPQRERERETV